MLSVPGPSTKSVLRDVSPSENKGDPWRPALPPLPHGRRITVGEPGREAPHRAPSLVPPLRARSCRPLDA